MLILLGVERGIFTTTLLFVLCRIGPNGIISRSLGRNESNSMCEKFQGAGVMNIHIKSDREIHKQCEYLMHELIREARARTLE